jgi:hypothetical protein
MKRLALFLLLWLAPIAAWAQGSVLQSGPVTKNHAVKWWQNGIIGDAGAVEATTIGSGIGELPIVNPIKPNPMCLYDVSPATSAAGWHKLCLGAGLGRAPEITYSAVRSAVQQPLRIAMLPVAALGVLASEFGADLTGATDATTGLQNCLSAGAPTCFLNRSGTLKILGNISIPAFTTLDCSATFPSAQDNPSVFTPMPAIRLDGNHTISLAGQGATLKNCLIYRNGMTFPVVDASAFTGTAVSGGGFNDVSVTDNIILGFDTCINVYGSNRVYLRHDYVDCSGVTHGAIYGGNNGDLGFYEDLKIQSLAGGSGGSPAGCGILRPGSGFVLSGSQGEFVDNIIAQNFQTQNFAFVSTAQVGPQQHLIGKIWSDYPWFICPRGSSIGINITANPTNTSSYLHFNEVVADGTQIPVLINLLNGNSDTTFDYLYGGASGSDFMQLGNGAGTSAGHVKIGALVINTAAGYAVNVLDNTGNTWIDIGGGYINNIHGNVAPYINVPNTYTNWRVKISDTLKTDLTNSSTIMGAITIPTCTGGVGVGVGSGSCSVLTSRLPEPFKGIIQLAPAGSPGAFGAVTLSFPIGYDNFESCVVSLRNGTGTWGSGALPMQEGSTSPLQATFLWNNGAPLVAGATYALTYNCAMQ